MWLDEAPALHSYHHKCASSNPPNNNTYPSCHPQQTKPTAAAMSAVYEERKDEDGFLYITYSGENTFGAFEELMELA